MAQAGRARRIAAAWVLMCALFAAYGPARAETLTDALISAYLNSKLLDQNRALLRAADEDVVIAMSTLKPVIAFVASTNFIAPTPAPAGDNWSANAALTAELTLFDKGVTRYATDAAKETVLGLRSALVQVEQQVLLNTVRAYMEVIRAAQAVSLGRSNVRLITQELRAARDRFEVGEVTRTDVSLAEARLAAARSNLAAAIGDLEIAREGYNALVGRYPGDLRWPPAPPITARTEAAAKQVAVRYHPSIEEAQHNVNAAAANVRRADAARGPTVTAGGRFSVDQDFDGTVTGELGVRVPIYSGGALRAAVRQAIARRDATRAALLQTVIDVKREVGTAWAQLAVAAAASDARRRQVRASQVAFDGVREEAKLGARTTLDVLNAEQELLNARVELLTAETQQYVQVYALLAAMGLLTVDHLNLGIATYDPAVYYNYSQRADPLRPISRQGRALDRVLRHLGGN